MAGIYKSNYLLIKVLRSCDDIVVFFYLHFFLAFFSLYFTYDVVRFMYVQKVGELSFERKRNKVVMSTITQSAILCKFNHKYKM